MSNDARTIPVFNCSRQRPTHNLDEAEDLGSVSYPDFIVVVRSIDWRYEANQVEWAMKASPTVAVTNQNDECTLWVSATIAGSIIDADAELDERFKVDKREPWYYVGINNPPAIANVVALDSHSTDDNLGFTVFTLERVEECFEWFFEEDYQSLYEMFRWV